MDKFALDILMVDMEKNVDLLYFLDEFRFMTKS